jgi:hypothetical protein
MSSQGNLRCSNADCAQLIRGSRAKRATGIKTDQPRCGHCALGMRANPPVGLQRSRGQKGRNLWRRRKAAVSKRRQRQPNPVPAVPPLPNDDEKKAEGKEEGEVALDGRTIVLLCGIGFVTAEAAAAAQSKAKTGTTAAAYRDRVRCQAIEEELNARVFTITNNQPVSMCQAGRSEPFHFLIFLSSLSLSLCRVFRTSWNSLPFVDIVKALGGGGLLRTCGICFNARWAATVRQQ